MAKQNWDTAFNAVIAHEGGFVDHPSDPGGATNLGITIGTLSDWFGRPASVSEVRALTKSDVKPIYKKNYWDKVKADQLPSGVDYAVYDYAVNSGTSRAVKHLQEVVGVASDGIIGPATLAAVSSRSPQDVINRLCDRRMQFLRGLSTFSKFGNGWTRRVSEVRAKALSMASSKPTPIPTPTEPKQPSAGGAVALLILAVAAVVVYFILKSIGVVP